MRIKYKLSHFYDCREIREREKSLKKVIPGNRNIFHIIIIIPRHH